ncbi:MAG TPA: response regulator [Chloroflexota bacterium]|jgi:CheY-like chemotaxis protein/phosphoribosyl 1,2-cyclic phosphodiesterase|nr:response regulator [Chloroflexota bacterium]
MKLRFWGTRGSIAVPGPHTVRFGGNTSCVELQTKDVEIILDCGTGVRELGMELMRARKAPLHAHILLSHTHWDHIQGFPFFPPALAPGNHITLYSARGYERPLKDVLAGQMDYTYFPLKLAQMASDIQFRELDEETFDIDHVQVRTHFLNHTTLTMGYRIVSGGRTVVYATDTEPFGTYHLGANGGNDVRAHFVHEGDLRFVNFVEGADVLIHDAQYTEAEYPSKVGWGHSTVDYAVEVALAAHVKHLVLFHHDTVRNDDQVAELESYAQMKVAERGSELIVTAAAEGQEIELEEREEERVHHLSTSTSVATHQYKLLFADDDPDTVELLRECFSDPRVYQVHVAHDGQSAIETALEVEPDLILLDMFMPGVDGYAVTQRLRSEPAMKHTPILIITGLANEQNEATGFQIGVTDFMRKPFALAQLRARVEMWLHRKDQPHVVGSILA